MGSSRVKQKNPSNQLGLNPNWAQLQQKLKSHGPKPPRPSNNTQAQTQKPILGKRKERLDAESDDSQINPLVPINDDSSVTDVIAMDCEMVGVGQGNKSALGRVSLVNKWGNVIYDEFVRPIERVVDFRTEISGIRSRDLRKAKDFQVVQKTVAEIMKGRILVGHALHNDLKVLLLSHPKKDLRDTSEYQPFLKEGGRRALRYLAAEFLGVQIQNGEHCPAMSIMVNATDVKTPGIGISRASLVGSEIDDARAAMLLYQKNRKEWEKSVKDQIRLKQKQRRRKPKKKAKQGDLLADHNPSTS